MKSATAEDIVSRYREPITGVWKQSPLQGPGAMPLVRMRVESLLS